MIETDTNDGLLDLPADPRMMTKYWIALLAVLSSQSISFAGADTDRPALKPTAALATARPSANWTGFYAGASVGGRWSNIDWDTTATSAGFGVGGTSAPDSSSRAASFDKETFRGAFYVGHNWQVAPSWVLGIEGDVGLAKSAKTIAGLPGLSGPNIGFDIAPGDTTTVQTKSDASIRGRAGYLLTPTLLAYATAGVSWLRVEARATCVVSFAPLNWCANPHDETHKATKTGWTAGAGVEWMLTPAWILRAEYRYADYGSLAASFFGPPDDFSAAMRIRTQSAQFGLAYRF